MNAEYCVLGSGSCVVCRLRASESGKRPTLAEIGFHRGNEIRSSGTVSTHQVRERPKFGRSEDSDKLSSLPSFGHLSVVNRPFCFLGFVPYRVGVNLNPMEYVSPHAVRMIIVWRRRTGEISESVFLIWLVRRCRRYIHYYRFAYAISGCLGLRCL
jgi:hypothetical protein